MPEEKDPNAFTWGRNERGDLLIDGIVVEKNIHFQGDATSELPDETTDENVERELNAEVEAKADPEAPPIKTPVAPAEAITEPPLEAPEPPKIPERQKYKLMVRGELQEKEYTKDELIARLQMAESYDLRNDELRQKHRKIEPYLHVFERPDFKEWLESKVAVGEIPAPQQPQPPAGEEVIRYRLRAQDPEFDAIRSEMVAWAATLPDQEAEVLNSSHKAFNDAYDHFKANRKAKVASLPPAPAIQPPKREVEKAIANKEVVKKDARLEPPGAAPMEVDPSKEWTKEYNRLRNAVRNGQKYVMYRGRQMDATTAWVMHRMEND